MARLLPIVLATGLCASLYANVKLGTDAASHAKFQADALAERDGKIARLETDLARIRERDNGAANAERATIGQLRTALAAQKDLADAADHRLAQARNGGLPSDADRGRIEDSIVQEKRYIQDLQGQLKGVERQLASLGGEDRADAAQANAGRAQDEQGFASQIQAAQAQIRQTEASIKSLRRLFDADSQQKAAQLKVSLQDEKAALNQLKAQKQQLGPAWNAQKSQLQAGVAQRRAMLQNSATQLQNQLATEKQNLARLQQDLDSSKKTRQTAKVDLDRLDADARAQRAKLQDLQLRYDAENQRLRSMGPTT